MGFSASMMAGVAVGCLSLVSAAPSPETYTAKRSFACDTLASGLDKEDCEWMAEIGMASQGDNVEECNDHIWIGDDGPNTFTFTNDADCPLIVVVWDFADGDYESSFMNVRAPKISYSLPSANKSVTISMANGVSGGWTALVDRTTTLSEYGQVANTWGEFTTGDFATVDISREVNMAGNPMSVKVLDSGCVSDMETCVFKCTEGNSCGESGTYDLVNCENGSQEGAAYGTYDGVNPEGGCQGFSSGGHLDISLGQ